MTTLVLDLDNTLYDWVTYYARSFYSMLDVLEVEMRVSRELILDEFRQIHVEARDSEVPFAFKRIIENHVEFARRDDIERRAADAFSAAATRELTLYRA